MLRKEIAVGGIVAALLVTSVAAFGAATGGASADFGADVVINELMINPREVYDSRGEWIELYNRGDETAHLEGWTLGDEFYDRYRFPDVSIAPGEFLVMTRLEDKYVNGGVETDLVYGNEILLFNSGDHLVLRDTDKVERDLVDWRSHPDMVPNGQSASLVDPSLDNNNPKNWCVSTTVLARGDLGSPGRANHCDAAAEPLVITEILQNPKATSDFFGEWFEVFNPGTKPVDMAGYTVKDDDHDSFVIDASVVVPAGGYAVFGVQPDSNGQVPLDYAYGKQMRLFNSHDELVIADRIGVQVDRVKWDDGRTFPDPNGASMSLLDPASDNNLGRNWCEATTSWATGDRGTPDAATWCQAPGQHPLVVTEIMFDPEVPASERASEWIEISNLGEAPVDVSGWTLTAGDFKTHTIGKFVIEPGQNAVLAASGDSAANGGITPDYVYGTNLPLFNKSGRIIVKSPNGAIVDRIDWSADAGFPIPSGRSITLGFPTTDNALGPNWCESYERFGDGDFGTPGTPGTCELPADPPALRLSEIMRNPAAVSDSRGEWFEIHNPTGADVDLKGWSFGDNTSDFHFIRESLIAPANGFVVLGRSTNTETNGGARVDYSYGGSVVLANNADSLELFSQHGQLVDSVAWDDGEVWMRPNGASMAVVDGSWCESGPQYGRGDRGTPGTANDCTPLAHAPIVISEVHIDSAAVSDTVGEWIELTNTGTELIDVKGWTLRDDDFDTHTIATSLVLKPGLSVVLGRETSTRINGGAPVNYSYGADFPLVNGADEINLLDATLVPVDRVTWTETRPLPARSGASAALRDLASDNAAPENWCTSITTYGTRGELGTPGLPNACEIVVPTTTTTIPATTTTVPVTTTTVPVPVTTTTVPVTTTTVPVTTPTIPVVTGVRPHTAGFGLLSLGDGSCDDGLEVKGKTVKVLGGARSNGELKAKDDATVFDGPVSYASKVDLGKSTVLGSTTQSSAMVLPTLPWKAADFAALGPYSNSVIVHLGDWKIGDENVASGIHYVTGDVDISKKSPSLNGVTIVALGTIKVSIDATTMSPFKPDLPLLLSAAVSCKKDVIEVKAKDASWTGLIAAPFGGVDISGKNATGGSVLGVSIKVDGSDLTIG